MGHCHVWQGGALKCFDVPVGAHREGAWEHATIPGIPWYCVPHHSTRCSKYTTAGDRAFVPFVYIAILPLGFIHCMATTLPTRVGIAIF